MTLTWRIIHADVMDGLGQLPDESVQCVVTSPPYWGLRDYGTAKWEGGDAECDHQRVDQAGTGSSTLEGGKGNVHHRYESIGNACPRCGARRIDGQLGREATPEEHVEKMVAVFREVKRVMRKDGTLWLNYGDAYAANTGKKETTSNSQHRDNCVYGDVGPGFRTGLSYQGQQRRKTAQGNLKPKDLVGMPWRVAFALQADGWYLRSDIIWAKPNPMPESVTDRPTKAHEYVFLLTRSPRYFYDADAVREEGEGYGRSIWNQQQFKCGDITRHHGNVDGKGAVTPTFQGGRNLRTVWTIATEAYSEAHFATFPKRLVEPCVLAGSSEKGCCPTCGAPWARVVEASGGTIGKAWTDHQNELQLGRRNLLSAVASDGTYRRESRGWIQSCKCPAADPIPCTILDPFAGSGTVGVVALRHGRSFVGIELNAKYVKMARRRISLDMPLFNYSSEEREESPSGEKVKT